MTPGRGWHLGRASPQRQLLTPPVRWCLVPRPSGMEVAVVRSLRMCRATWPGDATHHGCHPSQGSGVWVGGLSAPRGSLAPVWSRLLRWLLPTALLSPGRLQKEVRLAQKADYSAQRAASPLPYDKISVRCSHPSLRGVRRWGQAWAQLEGLPTQRGDTRLQRPASIPVLALSAAWGQDAGSERPDVPLPAPKAADALHGEVSGPRAQAADPVAGPCPCH